MCQGLSASVCSMCVSCITQNICDVRMATYSCFISRGCYVHFSVSRRAHTITALVLITLGLIYVSLIEQTPDDTTYNTKRGLVAVVVVFILIGIIHMPDGPFLRPHPVFWRLVLCVTILYVLLLIFMLFQVGECAAGFAGTSLLRVC